jgi:hypothetical protein
MQNFCTFDGFVNTMKNECTEWGKLSGNRITNEELKPGKHKELPALTTTISKNRTVDCVQRNRYSCHEYENNRFHSTDPKESRITKRHQFTHIRNSDGYRREGGREEKERRREERGERKKQRGKEGRKEEREERIKGRRKRQT